MGIGSMLARLLYPARVPVSTGELADEELEAWIAATGDAYFKSQDRSFVERARSLGVDAGMMLDVGSRLGLVAMKILWDVEDLFCMGVYRNLQMAEGAREIAEDWKLGERMFFQVGEPTQMKFKTGYFDLVVSDGALHGFRNPMETLKEIHRVTKPTGAILVRELRRPNRFKLSRHVIRHGSHYGGRLRNRFEAEVKAGFTPIEFDAFARAAGMARARVVAEKTHVILERPGSNDPASWLREREKYM
jgi:SAM-dependent methyltransferase